VSTDLFQRYKDALRRGHVAVLRGRLEEALGFYQEATRLAPERALPYTSLGGVHLRLDNLDAALAAYGEALGRVVRDETALAGRAEALARLGRRVEAAEALDVLSEVQELDGRISDACDTARRALELAEQKARRRHVQELTDRLRLDVGDQASELALARALRILEVETSAGSRRGAAHGADADEAIDASEEGSNNPGAESLRGTPASGRDEAWPERDRLGGSAANATATVRPHRLPAADGSEAGSAAWPAADAARVADALQPAGADDSAGAAAPIADPVAEAAIAAHARETEALRLLAAAEQALDGRDAAAARRAYVTAATALGAAGLLAAALDACYIALGLGPQDPAPQLALAELYIQLGWASRAADKLVLLGRLVDLDGDTAARERLCVIADAHFPDDVRLAALCA